MKNALLKHRPMNSLLHVVDDEPTLKRTISSKRQAEVKGDPSH